jgi:hypothetical protein
MRLTLTAIATLTCVSGLAQAQIPACAECVNTPPVYNPATGTSYVLIKSACDFNNPLAVEGWNRAQGLAVLRFNRNLATIESQEENDFILTNLAMPIGREIWIGLWYNNNVAGSCNTRYVWIGGSSASFRNWSPNEPNCAEGCFGFGNVGYVAMSPSTGKWNDTKNGAQCCYGTEIHGLVEIACPDAVQLSPDDTLTTPGNNIVLNASLNAGASGYGRKATYQWRRNGIPLTNGVTPWGSTISGARTTNSSSATTSLTISNAQPNDTGEYDVAIITTCRPSLNTEAAIIQVRSACPADLNADNKVDDDDFVIFAAAYNLLLCSDPSMPAGCPADLNADTNVDDADFALFAPAYNLLLCP